MRGVRELLSLEGGRDELLDGMLDGARRRCCAGERRRGGGGINIVIMNKAWGGGKDRVVLANGSIGTRVPRGAALSEDDLAGLHDLTSLLLVAETFTGRVAVVLGRATTTLGRVTGLNGTSKGKSRQDGSRCC